MAQFGQFALAIAFIVAIYAIVASVIGIRSRNDKLIASGRNAAICNCIAISTAIFSPATASTFPPSPTSPPPVTAP